MLFGKKIDGRYFLFGSHLTLVFVAYNSYRLHVTVPSMIAAYIVAVSLELFLHFTLKKYPNASAFDRALSAASEAAGLILLVYSTFWNYYALVSAVAVGSKYVFVRKDGTHIFNPTNFAIVSSIAVLPITYFSVHPDEYSLFLYPILHVLAFGLCAIYFGKSVGITLSYFATFLLIGAFTQAFVPFTFVHIVAPQIGAFGMIFGFLMITDPKTTPRKFWMQLIFGSSIALGVLLLRSFQICYPEFVSLFCVTIATYALSLKYPQVYEKPKGTDASDVAPGFIIHEPITQTASSL